MADSKEISRKKGKQMYCEICQKSEAIIHLTEIVEGVRTELHMCETCAQKQGLAVQSQVPINELLSNLLASEPKEPVVPAEPARACPYCGVTLEQFRDNSVLGCGHDYEVFAEQLMPLIGRAHNGNTIHSGKVPKRLPEAQRKESVIAGLRQKLEEAIRLEKYEDAAKLRDQMRELE